VFGIGIGITELQSGFHDLHDLLFKTRIFAFFAIFC